MKKRIIYGIIIMAICACLLSIGVGAVDEVASGTCGDNLTWVLDSDGTLTISGTGEMDEYYINGDDYIKYNPPWYQYNSQIKDIVIYNGITSIGSFAFSGCEIEELKTLPETLKVINNNAFEKCAFLTHFDFPSGLESVAEDVFYECDSLTCVTLPDDVNCNWKSWSGLSYPLKTVIIPDSVTNIPHNLLTYFGCSNYDVHDTDNDGYFDQDGVLFYKNTNNGICKLISYPQYKINTVYTIPDFVTILDYCPFESVSSLETVNMPNTITQLKEEVFLGCDNLICVNLPITITNISNCVFNSCRKLSEIKFPASISYVGRETFRDCSSLEKIYFYGNAPEIDENAFEGALPFFTIYYNERAKGWSTPKWNGYTAYPFTCESISCAISLTPFTSSVSVGDTVYLNITANVPFSAAELSLSYDNTCLTFNKSASTLNTATVTDNSGTLALADYGESKSSYIFAFDTTASGTASFALTSAAFSDAEDAASEDLIPAVITTDTVTVTINEAPLNVILPDILTGNSSVEYGEDYSFGIISDGKYYDYVITAAMAGESVEVIDNGDGTYTIENVTGELIISATRTPKEFTVEFVTDTDVDLPDDGTIVYGEDYTLDIPETTHYSTNIEEARYVNLKTDVPYSVKDSTVTIKGTAIIDDIVITINQVLADAAVTIEGNGASDANGYAPYAIIGEAYTLTIAEDARYDYVVTAKVNGKDVTLTEGNSTYTISADDVEVGSIVFTITKTLKNDNITVSKYLTLNGTSLWLIINDVDKIDGMMYCYNDTAMYWSDKYSAYCTVIVSSEKPEVSAESLSLISGMVSEVVYTMDINKSGKLDANDAQFVYNMYNGMYSGITEEVTAEKYLRADVNGDGSVNTQDAAAVISIILNNK